MSRSDKVCRTEEPTFVYVVAAAGRSKIGLARDPEKRVAQLQLASPVTVTLVHKREFSTRLSATTAERRVHRKFKDKHLWGEWFDVPAKMAITAVNAAPDRQLHSSEWHPEMPPEVIAAGSLGRWQWKRERRRAAEATHKSLSPSTDTTMPASPYSTCRPARLVR